MRVLVQRSGPSHVSVDGKVVGSISHGMVLLVGFHTSDTIKEVKTLAKKIVHLRIFDDENHIMNLSILDSKGSILSISQFTLYADSKKGNRPSYVKAMKREQAIILYDALNQELRNYGVAVETGIFGADMNVSITNDGPITILLESEQIHDFQ